jgi:hypothetical protein
MKEAIKNTIIEFYKSGVHENVNLADAIMDNQKHIPMRQLKAINNAINEGSSFYSRHAWRLSAAMHEIALQKSYDRSKSSLKYINK